MCESPAFGWKTSVEASTVDAPKAAEVGAYGGTTWSKKPSFSS